MTDRFATLDKTFTRRRALMFSGSAGVAFVASACVGGSGLDPLPSQSGQQASPPPPQAGAAPTGPNIGSGPVRVALVLPLSAAGGIGAASNAIRNAADLAMSEFDKPDITILVKDDRGDPNVSREMVQQALAEVL